MTIPKLSDKIYGRMSWDELSEREGYWFAPMELAGKKFDLLVYADSPLDFLAVRMTHPTYQKLLNDLNSIREKMIARILENSRELFKKKRHRYVAGETLKRSLDLYCIKIFQDLSAEVEFAGPEEEEMDEIFYAVINVEGNVIDAGISEF